jgi:DNA-binding response OmpR family regulator
MERNTSTIDGSKRVPAPISIASYDCATVYRGKTQSRKILLERVWRFDFDPGTNMVDVNVARLRAKLAGLGATCRLDSARGIGYVFNFRSEPAVDPA